MFILYIIFAAWWKPELVGLGEGQLAAREALAADEFDSESIEVSKEQFAISIFGVLGIICAVLGGIWFGIFTPTEGAGAGAALALILAFVKGMTLRGFIDAIYAVGKTAAPILILLLCAALYSRTLAMAGVTTEIRSFFVDSGFSAWTVFAIIILIWFILGMIIDSISIMLLTVPIVEPVAMAFGFDQLTFAIVGIIAIEAGLLTPPFGLLVYTVKAAITDDSVGVQHIFWSCIPYWLIMLFLAALMMTFPIVTNLLANALM
jgi:C4-dicarboxylate transporter DctM subunit